MQVASHAELQQSIDALASAGHRVIVLDGRSSTRREELFRHVAAALQFPAHFGHNWNAFIDCVNDLSWLDDSPIDIVVRDAAWLLIDGEPDEFGLFLRIVRDAAAAFAAGQLHHRAMPFRTVLHALETDYPRLLERVGKTQVPLGH